VRLAQHLGTGGLGAVVVRVGIVDGDVDPTSAGVFPVQEQFRWDCR